MKTERNPTDVAFGAALRRHRTARQISLEEMGRSIGVTYQQVQKYETGANRVSLSTVKAIAGRLGITTAELAGAVDEGTKAPATPSARALRLQGLADRLPVEIQDSLEALIESVIDNARASNPQSRDVQVSLSH